MKNMANTPMDQETEPTYPFGLTMTLGSEELSKLELDCGDEDCQVGNYIHVHALAEIIGLHKTDVGDGEKTTLVLQVTHMKIEDEDSESDEANGD